MLDLGRPPSYHLLMPLTGFHPAVARWFAAQFAAPSEVQARAWPAIHAGEHTLIAAPTGAGKTLAAFLAALDALVQEGLERPLPDETRVLYVSPLKALSNDIHKNLELPLAGIRDALLESGLPDVPLRAAVRTGDTSPAERKAMSRTPPHILVTTPESLYILLTSDSGRDMLRTVRSVIVDELHAVAGNKRGAHLTLSLERLAALCETPPVRIGLSATQKPVETMARYLTGSGEDGEACRIVDTGHVRERELAIEVPRAPLEAVMANEVWGEIYDRLAELAEQHRTTLIFVNTRRLAERVAAALAERLGEAAVAAHHGSLAKEHRLDAEQRLKAGSLRALVATASLELGIDIGEVDLVCQLGSPRAIATFLQRVGRSGHRLDALPRGKLFPLSRDELLEATALLDAIRRDELDRIPIPDHPLDVLAQQIVAEVASAEWDEASLFETFRRAWPYRDLEREQFTKVVKMLAEGFHTRRGRRSAWLHRDAVHGKLRARKGARLTALTNAGAIPDQFDYDVILQPEGLFIGTLNEDFAFESLPGDIFQLGNTAYRMLKIEQGRVFVEDAKGQPPNIPFWFGEAPGRSDELSAAVSRLRETLDAKLEQGMDTARQWLQDVAELEAAAAGQLLDYVAAAKAALGVLPSQRQIVFERFFDETGDMHLVIHAPFGSRLNRAWGLALRKRFCRRFNFELQAAANEDSLILSLGPTHSFPLAEPAGYLKPATVRQVLIQALLDAPMFAPRWRWVANTALAVPRQRGGKRVPPPFQRNDAEDLIALVFPDQLACLENIAGDREIPDHPLVQQTLWDCLHELMDIDGLERLLQDIESGTVRIHARDLTTPSPLALEILNARPYAFLDDGAAEERRTLAVQQQRHLDPRSAADIGRLDPQVIAEVCAQAWPQAGTPDELHDALCVLGFLTETEGQRHHWQPLFRELVTQGRATALAVDATRTLWVAAERLHHLRGRFPQAPVVPPLEPVEAIEADRAVALRELLRSRLEGLGPVTAAVLADPLDVHLIEAEAALTALENEGFAVRGQFTEDFTGQASPVDTANTEASQTEWCERGLLARMHRLNLRQKRREIEPVAPAVFMRFLFDWQGLTEPAEGEDALLRSLQQLEGLSLAAASWEADILPARLRPFSRQALDELCRSGKLVWLRLQAPATTAATRQPKPQSKTGTLKTTPLAFIPRAHLRHWQAFAHTVGERPLSPAAEQVLDILAEQGASFFDELLEDSRLLRSQLEDVLGELVAAGRITADSFQGLRELITPRPTGRRARRGVTPLVSAGRWARLRKPPGTSQETDRFVPIEHIARTLLRRYGVVFRALLDAEIGLPPWRDLLYVYRRMEARGELRGGRFVEGFAGEQFALPEAVATLQRLRKDAPQGNLIVIAATDPLNLTGLITPGARVPRNARNRILYRDGVPIAISRNSRIEFLVEIAAEEEWGMRNRLLRQFQPERYHPHRLV